MTQQVLEQELQTTAPESEPPAAEEKSVMKLSKADATRAFQSQIDVIRAMTARMQERSLKDIYEVGAQVACLLGSQWNPEGTTLLRNPDAATASYGQHEIEEIAEAVKIKTNSLRRWVQIYAALAPQKYRALLACKRDTGENLFTQRMLIKLTKGSIDDRTRDQLLGDVLAHPNSVSWKTFSRRFEKVAGGPWGTRTRKTTDPSKALARFDKYLEMSNERVSLLDVGLDAFGKLSEEKDHDQVVELRTKLRACKSRARALLAELTKGLKRIDRALKPST